MSKNKSDMISILSVCAMKARLEQLSDEQAAQITFAQICDQLPIYEDVYGQLCEILDPHILRPTNPSGKLPASVVDSVTFLLDFWVNNQQTEGE